MFRQRNQNDLTINCEIWSFWYKTHMVRFTERTVRTLGVAEDVAQCLKTKCHLNHVSVYLTVFS